MTSKLGVLLIAGLLAACKGKSAPTTATANARPEPAGGACGATAEHVTGLMKAQLGGALADEDWPKVTAILDQHCRADGWSGEAMACMDAATDEESFRGCGDKLTEEQNDAVKEQFQREIDPLMRHPESDGMTQGAPPPDDPCGGGE